MLNFSEYGAAQRLRKLAVYFLRSFELGLISAVRQSIAGSDTYFVVKGIKEVKAGVARDFANEAFLSCHQLEHHDYM